MNREKRYRGGPFNGSLKPSMLKGPPRWPIPSCIVLLSVGSLYILGSEIDIFGAETNKIGAEKDKFCAETDEFILKKTGFYIGCRKWTKIWCRKRVPKLVDTPILQETFWSPVRSAFRFMCAPNVVFLWWRDYTIITIDWKQLCNQRKNFTTDCPSRMELSPVMYRWWHTMVAAVNHQLISFSSSCSWYGNKRCIYRVSFHIYENSSSVNV